jgi:hypothetical protein
MTAASSDSGQSDYPHFEPPASWPDRTPTRWLVSEAGLAPCDTLRGGGAPWTGVTRGYVMTSLDEWR